MNRAYRVRRVLAVAIFISASVVWSVAPATTLAAGSLDPPPDSLCGLNDEGSKAPHPVDGVHWECICHEPKTSDDDCWWEVRNDNAAQGSRSFAVVYSSSTYGCLNVSAVLVSQYFGGPTNSGVGSGFGETYSCDQRGNKYQPAGEYRLQAVLERWNGSVWVPETPLGYHYNASTTLGTSDGYDMGGVPDGGNGTYRLSSTFAWWEGGAWRGGTLWAPQLYMN